MKKIEAIIRPTKLDDIKEALSKDGIVGLTISHVMGCGNQKGRKEVFRGTEVTVNLLAKIKIELVVDDSKLDEALKIIINVAQTGEIGDGKIFVYNVEDVIRIRTGERGKDAI